jgi:predicted dehydrogenase
VAPIRIGLLGGARIARSALITPAAAHPEVEVVAIAARDRARAAGYARKHGIPRVVDSYEALVEDPDVDAIYNPLPNGLHGRWTIAALEAGKHVLCEKPFTANAEEAEQVAAVARRSGRVCMEAFHYRYHPLFARAIELVQGGDLGRIQRIDAWMCIPLLPKGDIRWDLRLAGGTLMDVGCYAVHQVRHLAGEEPEVLSARALERSPGVDRCAEAELGLPSGATAGIRVSMLSRRLLSLGLHVTGDQGELKVLNATAPQVFHRFAVRTAGGRHRERFSKEPSYLWQLRAFADAVRRGAGYPTDVDDAVANMRVLDAIYRAAGLPPRRPTP